VAAGMVAFVARAALDEVGVPEGSLQPVRIADGHAVFYTYYQISRDDESNEAETEPTKEGELKSHWEGSHSPFGFIWQIASATGWSVEYILKGVNYQTLIMMLSDAPRYIDSKENKTEKTEEEEAEDIVGFFQSNLKQ
jgi:hypothetical protein